MKYPDAFKYSEEHTWVSLDEDIATVGITLYAAEEMGDILGIDLPQVGDSVDYADSFGTLESAKTVSDIFSPVSGEVIEVNNEALEDPGMISEYPHDDGWLLKVKVDDEDEIGSLLTNHKYEAFILEEIEPQDDDSGDEFDDED